MANKEWSEQYKHPNWQRKRLEALEEADWQCENCGTKEVTLHVHHKRYIKGRKIWEYEISELNVLCEPCHEEEHSDKDFLNQILLCAPVGAAGQIAGLAAGYLNASMDVVSDDPGFIEMVRQMFPATFELGTIASVLQSRGASGWRKFLREEIKHQRMVSPSVISLIDIWDEQDG